MAIEEERQLRPCDLWKWFSSHHWKHWHGARTQWWPLESPCAAKWHRSVRSFSSASSSSSEDGGAAVVHCNQWYDGRGPESELPNLGHGPWVMEERLHSHPDGIVHPFTHANRFYQFPGGDLGWIRTNLDPNGPILVAGETQFMLPGKDGKLSVLMSVINGRLNASQLLEEARDTDEKAEPSWYGTVWKLDPLTTLESHREEPDGEFIGEEMSMTPTLLLKTDKQARWNGFFHGLNREGYALVHFPNNVTICVPKQASTAAEALELAFLVHWLVSDEHVRMIAWWYGQDGKFQKITTGTYSKR